MNQVLVPTPTVAGPESRLLTKSEFNRLAEVPPELDWFANLSNQHTQRAYRSDVRQFMSFVGIETPPEFRKVTRAHLIAWRKSLEEKPGGTVARPGHHPPKTFRAVRPL